MASDLTVQSDRALQRAIALAVQTGAQLKVLNVIDETLAGPIARKHEEAAREALADQIAAAPGAKSIGVSQEVIRGVGYRDIMAQAEEWDADLIVLGIHRHTGREMFRGTTSERIVRYGSRPVLVVKDAVGSAYKSALAAVDLSCHSLAAVRAATQLVPRGQIYIVYSAHRPFSAFLGRSSQDQIVRAQHAHFSAEMAGFVKRLTSELGEAAPKFEFIKTEGVIENVMRRLASELKPDVIAVGTHGRGALAQAVIGSVAEDLLADAPADVLTVKAAMATADAPAAE